jgi:hypothetical protein
MAVSGVPAFIHWVQMPESVTAWLATWLLKTILPVVSINAIKMLRILSVTDISQTISIYQQYCLHHWNTF